ncbi:MAG: hypothetical protein WAQ33_08070 [Gaiellaceae bacterium]
MKRMLLLVIAALLVAPVVGVVQAEPVNQFSFLLKNTKPDGRFTLIFFARSFDRSGGVPPRLLSNYLRLPAGAKLNRAFLNKRWYCDGRRLRDSIDRDLAGSGTPFADRVERLPVFIRRLARRPHRSRRDLRDLANARTCLKAKIGHGTAEVDARATIPALDQLVPSKFSIFFSRPMIEGGIAGFTVVGAADVHSDAPIVKKYPIVGAVHVALNANFVNDPTPDGLYGYKLVLPESSVNGLEVSIAQLRVVNTGLTILKGTCLKERRDGRCARRQKRTAFWFTRPRCPTSGRISFLSFYDYVDPQPDITQTFSLACPRFG